MLRVVAVLPLIAVVLLPLGLASAEDPPRPAEPEWTKDQTKQLLAIAEEYMELFEKFEGNQGRRDKEAVIAKARALGPFPARQKKRLVKDLMKIAVSGPKSPRKGTNHSTYKAFPGKYYLTGAGGGKKGIFIGLHGGESGIGDGETARSNWGGASSKGLIGVFPTANLPNHPRPTTWQSPEVEEFVMRLVRELKRTYKIDTNRIYVAGMSLGGSGSWHIGLRHADVFAAVSPHAGGCKGASLRGGPNELPGGYIANLYNTPIIFTHYDQDPRVDVKDARAANRELEKLKEKHPDGYVHLYIEGKGKQHAFPPKYGPGKCIDWMTKHRRDPFPEKVIWEPARPEKRMFFWLRKERVSISTSRGGRIVATNRENRIDVEVVNKRGLSVLLANEMFDPKKPVTVAVKGEVVFNGWPQTDPGTLMECILENIDPEQVFTYRIDL